MCRAESGNEFFRPIDPAAWLRIVVVATSILFAMAVHKFIRRT